MHRRSDQRGFSLIEAVMVVVIVAMLAAVAAPSLMGSKDAAEKISVNVTLRAMHTDQVAHMATRGRYARLDELNAFGSAPYGTMSGSTMRKREWIFLMSPTPTNATLRTRYRIIAYKIRNSSIHSAFSISENGVLETLVP